MRFWKRKDIGGKPVVGMVVATYKQTDCLQSLLSAFKAQTYRHFKILVVHDGPWELKDKIHTMFDCDERFQFVASGDKRENVFGHNSRAVGLPVLAPDCAYLGTCSGDAWYAPVFFEAMVYALQSQKADFAYCNMIHSHTSWQPLDTRLARGKIDLGCFIASSELIADTPWTSMEFAADWFYIEKMLKKNPKVAKVKPYLYVHS